MRTSRVFALRAGPASWSLLITTEERFSKTHSYIHTYKQFLIRRFSKMIKAPKNKKRINKNTKHRVIKMDINMT